MKGKHIPYLLLYSRLVLGPIMVGLCLYFGRRVCVVIFGLMLLGLLTDIFDGIIARRLGVSTEKMRITDSKIDVVFWICTGASAYLLWPSAILNKIVPIALLFALEGMCFVVSIIKFKRSLSTHAYLAKLWAITLFLSLADVILNGETRFLFSLCVVIGVLADVENMLIALLLKEWTHDVPSAYHAIKLRKGKPIKRYRLFNG